MSGFRHDCHFHLALGPVEAHTRQCITYIQASVTPGDSEPPAPGPSRGKPPQPTGRDSEREHWLTRIRVNPEYNFIFLVEEY